VPSDRGARQRLKILQLLAAVEADGHTPLDEVLVTGIGRLRRGMTAVVVTSSQDPAFIRPLAALRSRGIGVVVVVLDITDFEAPEDPDEVEAGRQRARGLRHALAEYELPTYVVGPHRPLAEVLAR
jgi:DNA invertase Pin-like site-specific DNA recombinase